MVTDNNISTIKWVIEELPESISQESAKSLLSAALKAREHAYAPYSSFKVGSAILTDDDQIFTGTNVENASYGATICAERTAVFNAVANGYKSIKAVAVVANYPVPIPPCGMCRQVITEFSRDAAVLMANTDGTVKVENMRHLLPYAFDLEKQEE